MGFEMQEMIVEKLFVQTWSTICICNPVAATLRYSCIKKGKHLSGISGMHMYDLLNAGDSAFQDHTRMTFDPLEANPRFMINYSFSARRLGKCMKVSSSCRRGIMLAF